MDRTSGLVVSFFEEARAVGMGEKRHLEIASGDLVKIADQPAGRAEFQRALKSANDPETKDQVVQFVLDLADSFDESAAAADRKVELVDRAGLTVAASITATGIGTTVTMIANGAAVGALLGPVGLLAGGLIGLVAVASGRHTLKRRSDGSKSAARKLRRLTGVTGR